MTRNACEQETGWAVFDAVPQGTLLRNKRSYWNTMHTVPDSVTLSAATEPCTVGGGGWEEVGWEGMRVYSYLGFPRLCLWHSLSQRGPQFQADRLCLLPQKAQCLSTSVNYCVSSRVLSRGSDSVRTHQSFTSLSLIPYKLTLDFKTFNGQI